MIPSLTNYSWRCSRMEGEGCKCITKKSCLLGKNSMNTWQFLRCGTTNHHNGMMHSVACFVRICKFCVIMWAYPNNRSQLDSDLGPRIDWLLLGYKSSIVNRPARTRKIQKVTYFIQFMIINTFPGLTELFGCQWAVTATVMLCTVASATAAAGDDDDDDDAIVMINIH